MNTRIQELALEAFDTINAMASEGVADRHTFDQAWFQLYNKQFAELIVQECIELCAKEHAHSIHTHAGPWNTAIKRCKESIACLLYTSDAADE